MNAENGKFFRSSTYEISIKKERNYTVKKDKILF